MGIQNTATINNEKDQYIAETLKEMPIDLKKSLHKYLSNKGRFDSLMNRLEYKSVSLEACEYIVTLYHQNELVILMDLLDVEIKQ